MTISTNVNDELLHHRRTVEPMMTSDAAVQSLLDAYRLQFQVDLAFVGEVDLDLHALTITHVSCAQERYNLIGHSWPVRSEPCAENAYDEDGLCSCTHMSISFPTTCYSLHAPIACGGAYKGVVGLIHFQDERLWTADERAAVQKLGQIMTHFFSADQTPIFIAAAQAEIIMKNRTLESIFTTTECGILRHTTDGHKVLSVNSATMRILGYDPQEAVKSGDFNLITDSVVEEDLPKLRQAVQVLTRVGDSTSVSYRVRHKDGGILNVVSRIKLLEEDGELLYQRFMIDYTAEATRQKRLDSEKEKRHLEIIYALGREYTSLYYVDLDSGISTAYRLRDEVYRPFEDFFSKDFMLEDGAAFYCRNFVHPDDQEAFLAVVRRDRLLEELSGKPSISHHYRAVYAGSSEFIQLKVVRAGAWGKHHKVILGFRNVDEEFSREQEQKRKLEAALANAEQASQAKTTFLHNVSHDIRTPLNAIVGFTTLASAHLDNREKAQDYLDKVTIASKHLLSLIADVLDMSRIESGKLRLELSPCDLLELLFELKMVIIGQIHNKQLDFSIDTTTVQNELVLCDMHCLQQILLNLLGNAVKYTGQGGSIELKIVQKPSVHPGYGRYEFRVKDTGIGMSPEFQSHVFDLFSRERSTTASGIPGTGLGLAIAKNLVTAMGGEIQVFSTPGKGSEFVVILEFVLPPDQPQVSASTELRGTRALVVDNNFHTCENLSRSLDWLGVRAEWTMSGTEALLLSRRAAAQNEPFHVYIVDWSLHDRSSYTLIQHLREEQGADPRIIVLIPYGQNDVEQDAKAAGATALCSKPVLRYELRDLLLSSAPPVATEPAEGEPPAFSPRKRLLLVEDNELNQEIASELLQEHGFLVEVADNGLIAVNMVRRSQPDYYDAILMDIQMPKMNGYEATRAIRALDRPYHANIPIIAMSANAFTEDKKLALASGMNNYITKPFDLSKLLFALREIGLS